MGLKPLTIKYFEKYDYIGKNQPNEIQVKNEKELIEWLQENDDSRIIWIRRI